MADVPSIFWPVMVTGAMLGMCIRAALLAPPSTPAVVIVYLIAIIASVVAWSVWVALA